MSIVYKALFDKVADPSDWRNPIDSVIDATVDEVNQIMDAITFYTGIPATAIEVDRVDVDKWNIKCVGYRNGPCGP